MYLDTPELAVYHDRLARNDGASLVRVRWYGPEPGPDDNVYVERKVHREKWTGEQSTKVGGGSGQRDKWRQHQNGNLAHQHRT